MKNVPFRLVLCLLIGGLAITYLGSCNKKDPATAEITVIDENEDRVAEADVRIVCTAVEKPTCEIDTAGVSNSAGQVEFIFDHPAIYGSDDIGFAVLKVEAWKNYDSTYSIIARDELGNPLISYLGTDSIVEVDSFYTKYGDKFIELQVNEVTKETITIIYED